MFTWGSKYLFVVAGVSFLGAAVFGLVSGGGLLGVASLGYKGGVGEHTGYTILIALGIVSSMLGVLSLVIRDGDAETAAAAVGADQPLMVSTPRIASYWGPIAAFGVACLIIGVALTPVFFILGVIVLGVVTLEWSVLAWSDRATGDEQVNSVIRSRVLGPLEVPMLATLGIAVVVIGLSRVLLTVPAAGSTAIAAVVAVAVFGSAVMLSKSNAPRAIISAIVAIAALGVLAGGIVGAVRGEREIAHHEDVDDHGPAGAEGEGE